jgi:serine acetyltransferase
VSKGVQSSEFTQHGTAMTHPFVRQLIADTRLYHELTRGGPAGPGSLAWTMLCNRGLWLLTFHRIGHYCLRQRRVCSPIWWFARLCKSVGTCFSVVFCKSAFRADCEIRGVVYLSNRGYLMCGARSIGARSVIHDRCTFGDAVARGDEGRPDIGEHVWIGPNCIIAGSVTIGDGATVLPGSFLTFNVPAGAVVKGNPALIVRTNFENSVLRRSLAVVQDVVAKNS